MRLIEVLPPHERRRALALVTLVSFVSLLDIAGVASVMPFLAVLADPTMIERWSVLSWAYDAGGLESQRTFLMALGGFAFATLIVAAITRSLSFYAQQLFLQRQRHILSTALLRRYTYMPYEQFIGRRSSDLISTLLTEAGQIVDSVLGPLVLIISSSILAVVTILVLFWIDPLVALVTILVLGGLYASVHFALRSKLVRLGEGKMVAVRRMYRVADELFHAFKSIKVLDRESNYLDQFVEASHSMADNVSRGATLGQIPRFGVEAVAFGGVILVAILLLTESEKPKDIGEILPLLGLFAFSGYRLLPTVQSIYAGLSRLRTGLPYVEKLAPELQACWAEEITRSQVEPVAFNKTFEISELDYTYPNTEQASLNKVSVTLNKGESLAIVGKTGSGKSTLADIIMGLLQPSGGKLRLDGQDIQGDRLKAWQRLVGYVPQQIHLVDRSLAQNIALGLEGEQIDMDRVRKSAELAMIDEFIAGLPEGYDTMAGDKGVKLSGGQRQRIGVARALYGDPEVIVFDEATSSLDSKTEAGLMQNIERLHGQKTTVIITHRLSTIQYCDKILVLENGKRVSLGTFDELRENNEQFQEILLA